MERPGDPSRMSLVELWKQLKARKVKTTGTKPELIARLTALIAAERGTSVYEPDGWSNPPPLRVGAVEGAPMEGMTALKDATELDPSLGLRSRQMVRKRQRDDDANFAGWKVVPSFTLSGSSNTATGAPHLPQYEQSHVGYDIPGAHMTSYPGQVGHSSLSMSYSVDTAGGLSAFVGIHVPPLPPRGTMQQGNYYGYPSSSSAAPAPLPMLYHPSGKALWGGPGGFAGYAPRASVMGASPGAYQFAVPTMEAYSSSVHTMKEPTYETRQEFESGPVGSLPGGMAGVVEGSLCVDAGIQTDSSVFREVRPRPPQ